MAKRRWGEELTQKQQEVDQLNQQVSMLQAQLEGYQSKERAIAQALTEAQALANRQVEAANQEALSILGAANQERQAILERNATLEKEAQEQGERIIEATKQESRRRTEEIETVIQRHQVTLQELRNQIRTTAKDAKGHITYFIQQMEDLANRENESEPLDGFQQPALGQEADKDLQPPSQGGDLAQEGDMPKKPSQEGEVEAASNEKPQQQAKENYDTATELVQSLQRLTEDAVLESEQKEANQEHPTQEERVWTVDEIIQRQEAEKKKLDAFLDDLLAEPMEQGDQSVDLDALLDEIMQDE